MKKIKSWNTTPKMLFVRTKDRKFAIKQSDNIFMRLLNLLLNNEEETVIDLLSVANRVMKYSNNEFTVDQNGQVFLHGDKNPVDRIVAEKLIAFAKEGKPYQSLINFWKNLSANPSEWSKKQLYGFLKKNKHPITEDGMFLAYKRVSVNEDGVLLDARTGEFINNIGQVVRMKRDDVNPDPHTTCSEGLHVASFKYANEFYCSGTLLTVLVNPRDVVAVPVDYHNQKMRCCEYAVIGIENNEIQKIYLSNTMIVNKMKDGLKQNRGFSFSDMTSKQIISFVKAVSGDELQYNLRSKRSIVKKAEEIFTDKNLFHEEEKAIA